MAESDSWKKMATDAVGELDKSLQAGRVLADRVVELESELVIESDRRAKAVSERDRANELCDRAEARVSMLEAQLKPRPMSESRAIALGVHIRIRSLSKGWVVCHCCDHVGWVVSIGDHDDVIRDGVEWLPLFPNEDSA